MADSRGTRDPGSRAGWVWVIVGIVAVGLIVWWVAAAVDGGEDEVATGEVTAVEEVEPGGEQVFGEGEGGIFQGEDEQAARSGEVLGETPTPAQVQGDEPEEIQQFTQWNERQERAQVDPQSATEGLQQLSSAIDAIVIRYVEQPGSGEQAAGGGPTRGQSQEIQRHQQQLQSSIQQLEQAQQAQQGQVFHEAANTAAQTLQNLQRQAQLDQLEEPVAQLQQRVQQIQVQQPLSQQGEQVRAFFDQSAQVVEQMNRSLQGAQTGGGPSEPDQQPDRQQGGGQ